MSYNFGPVTVTYQTPITKTACLNKRRENELAVAGDHLGRGNNFQAACALKRADEYRQMRDRLAAKELVA